MKMNILVATDFSGLAADAGGVAGIGTVRSGEHELRDEKAGPRSL